MKLISVYKLINKIFYKNHLRNIIDKILAEDFEEEKIELSISDLLLIEIEIEIFLTKIKNSRVLKNSKRYFYILDKIQFVLAKLSFKYGIILSTKLDKFVKDFDRLDDSDLVKYQAGSRILNKIY